ncbi:MAG: penicillin-binding protein activator LpoB [Herminiimonas sp.]|nr:penicillin-binding protein activator LpoB [Herminiimonas sp.]
MFNNNGTLRQPLRSVRLIGACLGLAFATSHGAALAAGEPKIAVTDLTYEEKVSQYFRVVSASSRSSIDASAGERETDHSYAARSRVRGQSESSYHEEEGVYTYIDRGELRTYTADLKGALLKSGQIRLVQARPYVGKPTERIYDIIARIKQGFYPGADYVLFGSVSNIAFRQESMPLAMGSSTTANLTLDLVADFSLINTRTYEVKAAFSASGSGQDTKIITRAGDHVVLNRGKVMQETSRSLAENAYVEMMTQLGFGRATVGRNSSGSAAGESGGGQAAGSRYPGPGAGGQPVAEPRVEPVKVYR